MIESTRRRSLVDHLRSPLDDLLTGLESALARGGKAFLPLALGLLAGWWIYVPVHELLHVAGCRLAGGSVTRLEIDELYGGALLARLFDFVEPGSEYAGRLSGFDTGGSDLVYLATDLAPFVFTLFPAIWLLRRAGRRGSALAFGALLPWALAPFLSLSGDAYEIGSLVARQLPPWSAPALGELLVGDDVAKKWSEIAAAGSAAPWGGFALACALGVAWASATYGLGSAIAARLGERPRRLAPVRR